MIKSLRRWGSSWPAKVLLGLLAISMGIFWGVSDIFTRDHSSAVVATVGDSEILVKDLHHELRVRLSQIEHQTGRRLTAEQVIAARLAFSVLTDLIERKVLDKEADRQGLAISDRSVQEAIIKDPQFHGEDKKFSRQKFLRFLQASGFHERQFLAFFKKELRRRQLLMGFLAPFQPSDSLSRLLLNAQFQERQGASLFVGSEGLESPQPAAGELEAFYDRDKERFRLPEKRSFSYGVLKECSHEQAQKLEDDLAAKPDLKDVALKYQFKLYSVGEVSRRIHEGQKVSGLEVLEKDPSLQQEILNEVFQLPVGQEPVVKGVGGGTYYVLQITKSLPSHIPSFAAVQHQALALWQQEEQEKQALQIGKKLLKDFESGEKSFQGFKVLPWVSLGRGVGEDIAVPPEVKTILFEMGIGNFRLVKALQGGVYIVTLLSIKNGSEKQQALKIPVFSDQMKGMIEEDLIQSLVQSLRSRYHVKINRASLKGLI